MDPATILASGDAASALPGPGPWDSRAWIGAALYVLAFAAALLGVWALVRTDGRGEGEGGA